MRNFHNYREINDAEFCIKKTLALEMSYKMSYFEMSYKAKQNTKSSPGCQGVMGL